MFLCFLHGQEPDPEPTLHTSACIRLVFISLIKTRHKAGFHLTDQGPGLRYSNGGVCLLTTLEKAPWSQCPCIKASWEIIHKVIWEKAQQLIY